MKLYIVITYSIIVEYALYVLCTCTVHTVEVICDNDICFIVNYLSFALNVYLLFNVLLIILSYITCILFLNVTRRMFQ